MTPGPSLDAKGWGVIINAVRTPLGLFSLIALALATGLTIRAIGDPSHIWAPLGVLALTVIVVGAIMYRAPLSLYHPSDWPSVSFVIHLLFPVEAIEIDLELRKCKMEVHDPEGRVAYRGRPHIVLGPGGWALHLNIYSGPTHSVQLELIEKNGRRWRVNPFIPCHSQQQPVLTGGGK